MFLKFFFSFLFFLLGTILGSFLGVVIYRLPRAISLMKPARSFCPHCEQRLAWWQNIPIVSWLLLRGRCFFCRHPIGVRFLLVELLMGVLTFWCYLHYVTQGWGVVIVAIFFVGLLVTVSFIDFEHHLIPDQFSLGGIILGIVAATTLPSWIGADQHGVAFLYSISGATLGFLLLWGVAELGKRYLGHQRLSFNSREENGENENQRCLATLTLQLLAAQKEQSGQGNSYEDEEVAAQGNAQWEAQRNFERSALSSIKESQQSSLAQSVELLLHYSDHCQADGSEYEERVFLEELLWRRSDQVILRGFEERDSQELESEQGEQVEKVWILSHQGIKEKGSALLPWSDFQGIKVRLAELILPREAMGLGDVKWLAALGAFLGWQGVLFSLMVGSLLGTIWGGAVLLLARMRLSLRVNWDARKGNIQQDEQEKVGLPGVPFGPFLSLAAWLWLVIGKQLVAWYLHLF